MSTKGKTAGVSCSRGHASHPTSSHQSSTIPNIYFMPPLLAQINYALSNNTSPHQNAWHHFLNNESLELFNHFICLTVKIYWALLFKKKKPPEKDRISALVDYQWQEIQIGCRYRQRFLKKIPPNLILGLSSEFISHLFRQVSKTAPPQGA